jgi:hypothetical protein
MFPGIFLAFTLFSLTVLGWELFGGHHSADVDQPHNDLAPAKKTDSSLVSAVTAVFRGVAYFGLGFGPMGLAGTLLGVGLVESSLWAFGVGLAALAALRLFSRLQSRETDSMVSDAELLWETAVVTVPLEPGLMGKVRFDHKGGLVERYAMATDPAVGLAVGTKVRIVELNADTVLVEEIDG